MLPFGKAPFLSEATTYVRVLLNRRAAQPLPRKGCGVTGVWQVTDGDIGRPATLLLGCKRRALAEFEECTFINKPRMECSAPERIDRSGLVQTDNGARQALPVCSILLGFLFAGFCGLSTGNFPSRRTPAFQAGDSVAPSCDGAWCVRSCSAYSANRPLGIRPFFWAISSRCLEPC